MLHLRSEWADRHPNMGRAAKGVGTVVIHHTAGAVGTDHAATLRGLEHSVTDHPAPGNSQPLIALDYNLMVFPDGSIWEGRGLGFEDGATYKFNAQSVSICAVGNYQTTQPTDELLEGIATAIQLAISGGWVRANPTIEGHRDVGTFATACPGQYLEAQIPRIRQMVSTGVTAQEEDDDMYTQDDRDRDKATAMKVQAILDTVEGIKNAEFEGGSFAAGKARLPKIAADVKTLLARVGAPKT